MLSETRTPEVARGMHYRKIRLPGFTLTASNYKNVQKYRPKITSIKEYLKEST